MSAPPFLIVGPTAPESLESSYARAFAAGGHQVHRWDPYAAEARSARLGPIGRGLSAHLQVEAWKRKAGGDLLQFAEQLRPALVVVIATHGLRAGTLAQLRTVLPDTLFYCLYPDSPQNLDSERIHCLPLFDRVFTSSPAWVDAFERLGARTSHYLPFAADTIYYQPVARDESTTGHEISFIGTWRPDREVLLERLARFDLEIWGSAYWKRRTRSGSPLPARWAGRRARGIEFCRVAATSKIMLNLIDVTTWPGPNMRVFEQSACGAFTLSTRTPAVLEIFREGQTIECFSSSEEACDKIDYYLRHEDARRRIAAASYRLVADGGHTYCCRVQQLMSYVDEDSRHA